MAKVLSRDITSSIHLLNSVCNLDDSTMVEKMIRSVVKELITQSKIKPISIRSLKAYDNGRTPTASQFKNPIIVAKYKQKTIILDGNHRVLLAKKKKLSQIKGIVLNLKDYPTLFEELMDYDEY